MKLQYKIGLSNLLVSLFFLIITGFVLIHIVRTTVYDDLDQHLYYHKNSLISQLKQSEPDEDSDFDFGVVGSQEWVKVVPWTGSKKEVPPDRIRTIFLDTNGKRIEYRELITVISSRDRYYKATFLESVVQWQHIIRNVFLVTFGLLMTLILLLLIINDVQYREILKPFYDTVKRLPHIRDATGFSERFERSTTDEIDQLHEALNRMLKQLGSYFEEQKAFISNASHELQTPLTIIYQKTESLMSDPNLTEETMVELAQIQETASRLSRLTKALLLISKIENKQFPICDEVCLSEMAEKTVHELSDFIEAMDLTIETVLNDNVKIRASKDLINAMFYNLIQNAIKFSPENSAIKVEGHWLPDRQHYQVEVIDQGKGISPDLLPIVFDRFKKPDSKWNDSPGLGLSIVKSICDLHDFKADIKSERGKGTAVTITIPGSSIIST